MQLIRGHSVRIRGHLRTSEGSAVALGFVTLQPANRSSRNPVFSSVRDAKGEFEITGVLPGRYRLVGTTMAMEEHDRLTGSQTLEVGDVDLDNVELVVAPMQTLQGRILIPEGRKLPAGVVVMLASADKDSQGGVGQVASDGTFTIKGLAAGDYILQFGSMTPSEDDLYLSTARWGEENALDGIRIGAKRQALLEVTLKANGGSAEILVKDAEGQPIPEGRVELVPDGSRRRQFAFYGDCRVTAGGTCKITGITPGEYRAYAFQAGADFDRRDPEALKPFEKYGKAVTFEEGTHQRLELEAISREE